jgi:cobyrinic acid a,c-diamide synthase
MALSAWPIPRLVIAAPQGRSGKTTLSLGLAAAFAGRGLVVQPFKKGPDYIDSSWLSAAAGRPCRTLDPFFMPGSASLHQAFWQGARGVDLALIEANHGLYDSSTGSPDEPDVGQGSSAALARLLQTPILLVVNAARMGRSVAAMVHGYQTFEPGTPIAGVVLNNVAQGRHQARLRAAIEQYCGLPVLGDFPRLSEMEIPDRHLGLVPQGEDSRLHPALEACRHAAETYLDLEKILSIASAAPAFEFDSLTQPETLLAAADASARNAPRIAVARDRAFSFYYPENLEALQQAGASLVFFSPLDDPALPDADAVYIGGGFPEMFLDELQANRGMRTAMHQAAKMGMPIYAECGGLMYLSRRIDWDGRSAEMAGVLPCAVELCARPQGHGYVQAEVRLPNPFFPVGSRLRGHEFHHSRLIELPEIPCAYRLERGSGLHGMTPGRPRLDGLVWGSVLASYTHLHAAGAPDWAPGLVGAARAYATQKRKQVLS